jgi:hypothetical protein
MHEAKQGAMPSKSHQSHQLYQAHQSQQTATLDRHNFPAQADPLLRVLQQTGSSPSVKTQAILNRSTGARQGQLLLQLQRQYGNHYVQRLVELSRQGEGQAEATPEIEAAIARHRGGGQPLDSGVRVQMESAFGTDFSNVRIHIHSEADQLNRALSARAFTTGPDIFFRQGEYSPNSSQGKELLAHELTHVVQQTGTSQSNGIQGKLTIGEPNDQYEQEADQVASAVMRMIDTGSLSKPDRISQTTSPHPQRMCAACAEELQTKTMPEEEELLQRKAIADQPTHAQTIATVRNNASHGVLQRVWSQDSSRTAVGVDALDHRGNGIAGGTFQTNGVSAIADTWQSKPRWQWCVDGGTAHSARWKFTQYTFVHDGLDSNFLELTVAGQLSGRAKAEDLHYAKSGAMVVGAIRVRTRTNPTPPTTRLFVIRDGGKSSANVGSVGDIEATIPIDGGSVQVRIPLTAVSEGEMAAFSESLTPPLSHDVGRTPGSETLVDLYLAARVEAQADVESTCSVYEGSFDDENWANAVANYTLVSWRDRPAPGTVAPGGAEPPEPGMGAAATQRLSYPGDCRRNTLIRAGNRDGCSTDEGANHTNVRKNGNVITQIPHTVKANNTCRSIIRILNNECLQ